MIHTVTLNPAVDRELTVPAFVFDSVLRATAWQVDYGGKGFNVSRMLRSLGAPSTALAFTGGKSGELLRDGLVSLGIETAFIWVEGETRTNVSIVNEEHDRYLKVNEPGPSIDESAQAALLDEVRARAAAGSWWVLAGSLPPGVPADYYARITTAVREQGGQVVLDTSGAALQHGCAAAPALVKPNDHELAQLTSMRVDGVEQIVAAAHAVRALGPAQVVVSTGKAGALAVAEGGAWLIAAPRIAEQNPIGAGDSLVAGLVWALDRGESLPEALRWGVACGAATAASPGTAVGERAAVKQLYAQTGVQQLAGAAR